MRFVIKLLLVLILVGLYFALAVWGGGGPRAFFAHPPLTVLAVATVALSLAALFVGGNLSSGEREDRRNRWVLWAFFLLGLLLGYVPAYTDRIAFWTLDGEATRWFGIVMFLIGGVLRLWPVAVLGQRFSGLVAIQRDHRLVTEGIYSVIRHPSYLGLVLNALGWALAFRSGVGALLIALMLAPLIARIEAEEQLLANQFGASYAAYRASTKRLVPGVY